MLPGAAGADKQICYRMEAHGEKVLDKGRKAAYRRECKPAPFLVCSDENLPQDSFQEPPVAFGSGQFTEDLLVLS